MHKAIDIDGQLVHYDVSGDGSPIILMHGWGCRASTLASVAKVAEQTHTVYNIDFPGFGDSPEPPHVWGVEEYTHLVERFIEVLGLNNPALLGHSFGGRVAILYSSRHKADRIVLVDAAGLRPKRKLSYYLKVYSFKLMKMIFKLVFGEEGAKKHIEKQRARRGSADYASASPRMRAILSKVVNEDLSHCLPLITAPTLLIWGENDTATPLTDAKRMERNIPDAGLVSFPGCGHYSFLDNPVQFAATLNSFLSAEI